MGTDGWGGAGGDWVLEVLGVLWGTTGYYQVPLGSVKYYWVFLGYWVVLRGIGGRGCRSNRGFWGTVDYSWALLGTTGYWIYCRVLGGNAGAGYWRVPPSTPRRQY